MCAYKEKYPVATQQNVANSLSRLLGNPISRRCVRDILRETKKWHNETCENVRWLKGAELKDLIWMGQVDAKNGTATDEVNTRKQWTADECDKFCIQKLIRVCILLQKLRLQ
jgi:hypothetical protein